MKVIKISNKLLVGCVSLKDLKIESVNICTELKMFWQSEVAIHAQNVEKYITMGNSYICTECENYTCKECGKTGSAHIIA